MSWHFDPGARLELVEAVTNLFLKDEGLALAEAVTNALTLAYDELLPRKERNPRMASDHW